MGELADGLRNGFYCFYCGLPIDNEEPGYPRYCSKKCEKEHNHNKEINNERI